MFNININIVESNKCIEKCASLNLNNLKKWAGGLGGRAQRLPPKADWKHLFYMQGAGLNVILKVYRLHDMHPGNMWNTVYILIDTYLYLYIYINIYIHLNDLYVYTYACIYIYIST